MSTTVCMLGNAIGYPEGGGHIWAYLNWALALRSVGCEVRWVEIPGPDAVEAVLEASRLARQLEPYGFESVELASVAHMTDLARDADALISFVYAAPASLVRPFRRRALIDIDPGQLQVWMHRGDLEVAEHDVYFTTGEGVGLPGSQVPDAGQRWIFVPPCVDVASWPVLAAPPDAPFTTVSQWWTDDWVVDGESSYSNSKRDGFEPFLALPSLVPVPLELALNLGDDDTGDRALLVAHGWQVSDSHRETSTTRAYQHFIQRSRGEFSCAKPSSVRLGVGWVSDRTLCYLASGRPAVVQHTGPSSLLPDGHGTFRFRSLEEASDALVTVAADYENHARAARELAEAHFDGPKVASTVLSHLL